MKNEILIYQNKEGETRIDVVLKDETVWLTQRQLAELFQTTKQNISLHIKNIIEEGELEEISVVKEFLTTARDRKKYRTLHYNLDMIISVGYRAKSRVATQFRIWATQHLREFLIKGFILDDERLKEARNNYFDELLSRIRDIRSSEKVFFRKVCDVFATSIDYDGKTQEARNFFATVQNKFHWAIHTHTAAELIQLRANASEANMGLTNWPGPHIRKEDVSIAKNYLTPEELEVLNRIVTQYLEFAELQAMNRKPMHMAEWETKLNAFLTLNDRDILTHKGNVSHQQAVEHAAKEYAAFTQQQGLKEVDELDKYLERLPGKVVGDLKGGPEGV